MRRRHLLLTAAVVAGALPAQAGAAWRAPVNGRVIAGFDYRRDAPFERGARRGVLFAAGADETVRAACTGTVTYAGASPRGQVVSVSCGQLIATHLGLASVGTGAGDHVRAGSAIATAGPDGVGLGARQAGDRWGYVDPLTLLAERTPDIGPAPAPRRTDRPRTRPAGIRIPAANPAAQAAPGAPLLAWAGLALVAATLAGAAGTGAVSSVRRRWAPSTSPRRSTM